MRFFTLHDGVPGDVLFEPTDPMIWAPHEERFRVIAAEPMEGISVDAVVATAEAVVVRPVPSRPFFYS